MTTALRIIDPDVQRGIFAAFNAKCDALLNTGQKLLARIRPTSKYYGQGDKDSLFPVVVASNGQYVVIGGPGGQYRRHDVDLFVIFSDDSDPIQITFEK